MRVFGRPIATEEVVRRLNRLMHRIDWKQTFRSCVRATPIGRLSPYTSVPGSGSAL